MTGPLLSTLVLGLGWFAAINLVASALAWCAASLVLRREAARRGGVLLAIRLLPAAVSSVFVAILFVPAHWMLEPASAQERFGIVLWIFSALGAAILLRSTVRVGAVARAGWGLRRFREFRRVDADLGVYEVQGLAGVSLAGVFRTRILVGPAVRRALSGAELDVALAHERAHRTSLDNVKRCAMFCAPDVLGLVAMSREVEARWRASAEWLADAQAVDGDDVRAVHLASALVKVSRITSSPTPFVTSPAWSTLNEPPLLEMRVRRLVGGTAPAASAPRRAHAFCAVIAVCAVLLSSAVAVSPSIHHFTEALVRLLP